MAQHLLIQVSHHFVQATHANHCLQRYRLVLPKCQQAKILCRPPGGTPLLPSDRPLPYPMFQGLSPDSSQLATRHHAL